MSAEQEKQSRYKGHAQALSVELRGGITSTGLSLLEQLSREGSAHAPGATVVSRAGTCPGFRSRRSTARRARRPLALRAPACPV